MLKEGRKFGIYETTDVQDEQIHMKMAPSNYRPFGPLKLHLGNKHFVTHGYEVHNTAGIRKTDGTNVLV